MGAVAEAVWWEGVGVDEVAQLAGEGEEGAGCPGGIGAGGDGGWRDWWRFWVGGQFSEEVERWWVVAVVFWHC